MICKRNSNAIRFRIDGTALRPSSTVAATLNSHTLLFPFLMWLRRTSVASNGHGPKVLVYFVPASERQPDLFEAGVYAVFSFYGIVYHVLESFVSKCACCVTQRVCGLF